MQYKYVFYIDSMQFGGANRVMANLVNYFSSKGADVVLINDIIPDKDIQEYDIKSSANRFFWIYMIILLFCPILSEF